MQKDKRDLDAMELIHEEDQGKEFHYYMYKDINDTFWINWKGHGIEDYDADKAYEWLTQDMSPREALKAMNMSDEDVRELIPEAVDYLD